MDKLLFGDNQFFGVNHMSEERARAQAMRFQDLDAIMAVLDAAYQEGITTFMCTTHGRIAEVCERIRREPERYPNFTFYPCMPYAHKYADAVTEDGLVGAVRRFLPSEGLLNAALRSGRSLAKKDIEGITTLLIDTEMAMFAGLSTPVIWLQNIVVDLLLGLGFDDAFRVFHDHVRARYGAEPGFVTMNLPLLLDTLNRVGIDYPTVCANINRLGFRMPGGVDVYRQVLASGRCRAVAMSVYASGAIDPRVALEWVFDLPNVESVVFGASSRRNIRETREIADEILARSIR